MNNTTNSYQNMDTHQNQYLTAKIGDQLFGLPVFYLRDIFKHQEITPIPLAPKDVLGSINLRGRIVTVIDLRRRFNIPINPKTKLGMNIAVEYGSELFSLVVDSVGDVMYLSPDKFESLPPTLERKWQTIASGVCQLNEALLISLNMDKLLNLIVTQRIE